MDGVTGMYGIDVFGVFFFNDTATTEIYTLFLHDALPICQYFHIQYQISAVQYRCYLCLYFIFLCMHRYFRLLGYC